MIRRSPSYSGSIVIFFFLYFFIFIYLFFSLMQLFFGGGALFGYFALWFTDYFLVTSTASCHCF